MRGSGAQVCNADVWTKGGCSLAFFGGLGLLMGPGHQPKHAVQLASFPQGQQDTGVWSGHMDVTWPQDLV